MTLTAVQTFSEIVKPMQRGQITIPINIRKKLNITSQTWLWVKLIQDKILIEPVEKEGSVPSLLSYLNKSSSDSKSYWTKKDSSNLGKVSKKSSQRLIKLVR